MNHISVEMALHVLKSEDHEYQELILEQHNLNRVETSQNIYNKYSDQEYRSPIAIDVALSALNESPDPKNLPQPKFLNSNPTSVNSSINSSSISEMCYQIESESESDIKKDEEHKKIFFKEIDEYNNMFKISYKEDEKRLNENTILKMKIYEYLKKYKDLIYQPDIIENIVVLNCDKTQLTYRILVNFRYGFKSEIFYLAKKKYVKDQEKYHTKLCSKYDKTFGIGCNYGIKCQFAHLCKRCNDDKLIFY